MTTHRRHVLVSGRVQGVFFRESTRSIADSLNLTGWVTNLPDGRVEAIFEGDEDSLHKMLDWCHDGPEFARVENVTSTSGDATGEYGSFEVL